MLRKCALFLLLLLVCGSVSARAERTVVCATSADVPPLEFVDDEGKIVGYAIDLIRAAGGIAGFKAEFKKVSRDALAAGLQSGQYDAICSSVGLDEESRKAMDVSTPYLLAKQVMLVNSGTTIYSTTPAQTLRVGTLPGIAPARLQGARMTTFNNLAKAMEEVYVKGLDGVVSDEVVGAYFATVKYQGRLMVTGYLGDAGKNAYSVAVKKGNKEILSLVNQGISTVQAREIDKELGMKWFAR